MVMLDGRWQQDIIASNSSLRLKVKNGNDNQRNKKGRKMNIPMYEEVEDKVRAGKQLTPLDIFILDNEPAGEMRERQFRDELQTLIDYVVLDYATSLLASA